MNETGSYAAIARHLNREFRPEPLLDRRRIYDWYHKGTRNTRGEKPPEPVRRRRIGTVKRTQPRLLWELSAWSDWYAAGLRPSGRPKISLDAPE
jgi:hypothetical protein